MINLDKALTVLDTLARDNWMQHPETRMHVKDDYTAAKAYGVLPSDIAHPLGNRRAYAKVRERLRELEEVGLVVAWGPFFWPRGLYEVLK